MAGLTLNLYGLGCGVRAFASAHRAYGSGPLFPRVVRAAHAVQGLVQRLLPRRKKQRVLSVSGSAHALVGGSARLTVRTTFEGLTDEERIERLVRAVTLIYAELDEDHKLAHERHEAMTRRIDELGQRLRSESQRLEDLARDVASADAPLQLRGLLCVALGTILLTIPAASDLLISVFM